MIWIDGDACPAPIKEIIYRASEKKRIPVRIVANRMQKIPKVKWIQIIVVDKGDDVADQKIVAESAAGDLVITADVPFAQQLVAKQVHVITPSGDVMDMENIGERVAVRNFLADMRESRQVQTYNPTFNERDKHKFAAAFDRYLAQLQG